MGSGRAVAVDGKQAHLVLFSNRYMLGRQTVHLHIFASDFVSELSIFLCHVAPQLRKRRVMKYRAPTLRTLDSLFIDTRSVCSTRQYLSEEKTGGHIYPNKAYY
jgi:hypothetical protein